MKFKKIFSLILILALIISTLPGAISANAEVSANTPETVYPGLTLNFDSLEEATGSATNTEIASSIITLGGKTGSGTNQWVMGVNNVNSAGSGKYFADIVKNGTEENSTPALLFRMNTGGSNSGPQIRFMVEKTWYRNQGQTVGAVHSIEMDVTPLSGAYIRLVAAARTTRQEQIPWIYIFNNGKIANTQSKYTIGHTYHVKLTFDTAALKYYLWLDDVLYEENSYTPTAASLNPNTISFIEYTLVDQFTDISAENEAKLLIDNYKSYYTYDAPAAVSVGYTDSEGTAVEADSVKYNAQCVNVTLSRAISNTAGNIKLRRTGGADVSATVAVSDDGKNLTLSPADTFLPGASYEIVLDSDITYDVLHASSSEYSTTTETRALGNSLAIPFTTQSEVMILSPENGEEISSDAQSVTLTASVEDDVTLVEFYVDEELVGSAVPTENNLASLNASIKDMAVGTKEVKAICYGEDVSVLYSSFLLNHKAVYNINTNFSSDCENSSALFNSAYIYIAGDASDKSIVPSTDIVAKGEQAAKFVYKKPEGSVGTNGKRYAYLYLNGEKVYGNNRMCDGTQVVDTWIYIPNKTDRYTFGMMWKFVFGDEVPYSDAECTQAMAVTASDKKLRLEIGQENIFNKGQLGDTGIGYEPGWHHLRVELDYENNTKKTFVDCNEISTVDLKPLYNSVYYMKDATGNVICEEGTSTPKAFEMIDRPAEMAYLAINHYDCHSATEADTEYQTAFILDDFSYYKEYEIPEIADVSYAVADGENIAVNEESYAIDAKATEISVTLEGKYAPEAVNSDNVKLYVDGTDTAYDSVVYEGDVVTITKADGFKENQKLEIVFGKNMTLGYAYCMGTVAGMENAVKLYTAKDGLYFDSSVVSKEGLAVAYVDIRTIKEVVCQALLGTYNDKTMIGIKPFDVTANGKECFVVSTHAVGADEAKIMVWNNLSELTPLGESASVIIQ